MNTRAIGLVSLLSISSALALFLNGCASNIHESDIETGPSMAESYQAAMQETDSHRLAGIRQKISSDSDSLSEKSLGGLSDNKADTQVDIGSQIDNEFPTLPNHDIVIYVYPHLAGDFQMPVPGYYTAVPFYSQVHYAIPGEIGGQ